MKKEVWKFINGYEGAYEVSNSGKVRSCNRTISCSNGRQLKRQGVILHPATNRDGYLQVALSKDNKLKSYLVHQLVGLAYIPNPENKYTLNHKDGIKANCAASNLEWATKAEQAQHSLRTGLRTMPNVWGGKTGGLHGAHKPVYQCTLNGTVIRRFESIVEAGTAVSIHPSGITGVCRGKHKTAGGYKWKFVE